LETLQEGAPNQNCAQIKVNNRRPTINPTRSEQEQERQHLADTGLQGYKETKTSADIG
jgi:hypothetical protein